MKKIFLILFFCKVLILFNSFAYSGENKILIKVNQEIITTYDLMMEITYLETINNDYNKVTELLARHNTLPLPSIVKITNLENGLFITLKVNDRHEDNGSLIQVSRKVAQLLDFYKNKIAKVRVEINVDGSKQWKNVTNSMNEPQFNDTVESAPTSIVTISNIDENTEEVKSNTTIEQPIELGSQDVEILQIYLIVYELNL